MNPTSPVVSRKDQVVAELAALGPMRKGSLTEQMVQVVLKDGTPRRRGPYTVYTFKERGQTISKRLGDPKEIALYRRQIGAFRRFQELTAELARLSQRLADLEAAGEPESKKNSRT
jgi:hypothetical protein